MRWKSRTVMYKVNDVAVLFSIYRHCPNLGKLRVQNQLINIKKNLPSGSPL